MPAFRCPALIGCAAPYPRPAEEGLVEQLFVCSALGPRRGSLRRCRLRYWGGGEGVFWGWGLGRGLGGGAKGPGPGGKRGRG